MPSDDPMGPADEPYSGAYVAQGDVDEADLVANYLKVQGATAFIAAAEAYFEFLRRAHERWSADAPIFPGTTRGLPDIDSGLVAARAESGNDQPSDLDQRMRLPVELLDRALDS